MRPRADGVLDYKEFPILYVDDEPENLRIFELTFRREFSIVTASSAEEGLQLINSRPVCLVLSDHRMPGMTGVEFLARARELDPKTVRILVTAYGDAETLRGAINSGSIYRFVPKPWTPEDMRVTLRRGIEVYALDRQRGQLIRELTLLNRVSRSINRELELEPLLDLLLKTVTQELGYDAAALLFLDAQRSLAWARESPGAADVGTDLRGLRIEEAKAPEFLRRVCRGEVQVLSIEAVLELEGPIRRWVTDVAAEEILVVPLMGKEGAMGVLAVDNRRGGRRFDAEDRTLLEGLTAQAIVAIENARLVEDLRRSREQVMRADRLGTLGTLAAGLAHEINNPLVSIHTFLSMASSKRNEDDGEFWTDYHALACSEVDRIRRLVETMRQLGRDVNSQQREVVDLAVLLPEVVALIQREADRERVELAVSIEGDPPKLHAVRDHLHQVVLNLLLNAIHAAPAGGRVRLSAALEPGGDAVRLEVADDGPGVAEADLDRIFDPFFTTKGPDQGTGLGLMICHEIVSAHGGSIEVRSRPGEGACFKVRLPVGSDRGPGAAARPLDPTP